jgi:hypothetical protein
LATPRPRPAAPRGRHPALIGLTVTRMTMAWPRASSPIDDLDREVVALAHPSRRGLAEFDDIETLYPPASIALLVENRVDRVVAHQEGSCRRWERVGGSFRIRASVRPFVLQAARWEMARTFTARRGTFSVPETSSRPTQPVLWTSSTR